MNLIQQLLGWQVAGNTGKDYLLAVAVFFGALIVFRVFKSIVLKGLKKVAEKTKTDFDDVLIEVFESFRVPFYLFVAFYFAIRFLKLADPVSQVIEGLFIVVIVFQIVKTLQIFINYGTNKILKLKEAEDVKDEAAIRNISFILKISLWVLAVLIVLSNWGVNITSLIAGLGIGGVALAFALQHILEDIFSSFSIFIDKPFHIGDYIVIGSDKGVVEKIGIKTTRLRTLTGQELVVPNRELTSTRVNNYKRMPKRRIFFTLGVCYETPLEKLKKINKIIEDIIEKTEGAEVDRVHFKEYADFSLNFEVVYYVTSGEYRYYMDVQQAINFGIKEAFEEEGIEFAYPTQTLFVKK
jgi:small-conductance mechanosensitive channel